MAIQQSADTGVIDAAVVPGSAASTLVSPPSAGEPAYSGLVPSNGLAAVVASLPGIVFQRRLSREGAVSYPFFSSGLGSTLGYVPEEMTVARDGALDCIHWADRDGYLTRMRSSAKTMTAYHDEFRCITADGLVCWLSGTLRPVALADGSILWDGVVLDVTDRMRAEQQLAMIMDNAAECLLTVSEGGMIEIANAATERLFGYAAMELIGLSIWRLLADPTLLAGFSSEGGGLPREVMGQRRDGTTFDCEITLSEVVTEGRRLFIAIVRDITIRKATEARLRETEDRLTTIASNIHGIVFQMVLMPDGRQHYTYMSDGTRRVLGVEPERFIRNDLAFSELMTPADRLILNEAVRRSADTMDALEVDIRLTPPPHHQMAAKTVWLRCVATPHRLPRGVIAWDGVAMDVTARKVAEDELKFLAYNDALTGLGNRLLFVERFSRARASAAIIDAEVAVLCIGFDRFSVINATMGHSTGDRVLQAAATRLLEGVSPENILCRTGGDRFLLLLSGVTGEAEIEDVATAFRARFETPLQVDGKEFDLSISVGAAVYPRHGVDAESLIMHAEGALQRAKVRGAGSFQIFTAEMGERAQSMLSMQQRLRRAIENKEFVAYFQPQVNASTGVMVGVEALVRWISPDLGLVMPGQFIDVAEEYGLIEALCEQVLDDACRWTRRWLDQGLEPVPVAVNISGRQFHNARLLMAMVDQVLTHYDLPARYLELELTESSAMTDPVSAINVVKLLGERGVHCSIDDFGTGYSSLSVLKRFPITKLKIDRSFVADVTTQANDAAIVCAIIALANALNLKVVAEGVETRAHLDYLHSVGCHSLQGYYFSRPVPGEELERLLRWGQSLPMPRPSLSEPPAVVPPAPKRAAAKKPAAKPAAKSAPPVASAASASAAPKTPAAKPAAAKSQTAKPRAPKKP